MSSTGDSCKEGQHKATCITCADGDGGYIGCAQVEKKGIDNYGVKYCAAFLDSTHAAEVTVRVDNEPALVQMAEAVGDVRVPRVTRVEKINRAEHQQIGAAERAHRTLQAQIRPMGLDLKARTNGKVHVIPGHKLYGWMVRHAPWLLVRYQPHGTSGMTS